MKEIIQKLVLVLILTLCFSLTPATSDAKMAIEMGKWLSSLNEMGVSWDKEFYKGPGNLSEIRGQICDNFLTFTIQFDEKGTDVYDYRIRSEYKVGALYRECDKRKYTDEQQSQVVSHLSKIQVISTMLVLNGWSNGLDWYMNNLEKQSQESVTTVGNNTIKMTIQPDPEGGIKIILETYAPK